MLKQLKKMVVTVAICTVFLLNVAVAVAGTTTFKNGDVWLTYTQDNYIHSQMYCEKYVHTTSTGYNDGLFGRKGTDIVLNRSGLTKKDEISYAKSGTHMLYVDRAWYNRIIK